MFSELKGEVIHITAGGESVCQCGLFLDSCSDVISHQERCCHLWRETACIAALLGCKGD